MERALDSLSCALIRDFSLPVTDPNWRNIISPSAWALTTSNIYKDYLKLTGDGRFCGNFRGFVFMYGYICDLYNLRDLPENV